VLLLVNGLFRGRFDHNYRFLTDEKLFRGFGDGFEKRVPTEGGALDAHRKLHDALKGLDIAKIDRLINFTVAFGERHHVLEPPYECQNFSHGFAFNGNRHHRRRALADRTALT